MPDLNYGKLPNRDYEINLGKKANNIIDDSEYITVNEFQKMIQKAEAKRDVSLYKRENL